MAADINRERVQAIIGHALAIAAQEDDYRDRELGPIHVLKYLYLADEAYAQKNAGESFTGIDWQFHKFGPWSCEAYTAIEQSIVALQAKQRFFPSQYQDGDAVRYSVSPDRIDTSGRGLPLPIERELRRSVKKFGADTKALLHHVYSTAPMLRAAPGESLSLETLSTDPIPSTQSEPTPEPVPMSKTRRKKMRQEVQRRLARSRDRGRTFTPKVGPYDEVFEKGTAWLNGEPPGRLEGTLSFSPAVWRSKARSDGELP